MSNTLEALHMQIKTIHILIVLFLCVFLTPEVVAQSEKEKEKNNISSAQNLYNLGRIDSTLQILRYQFSKESSFHQLSSTNQAKFYRLAAHAYTLSDKPDTAEIYLRKMLKIWPNYKENQSQEEDLERFNLAVDNLYALPLLQVGIKLGTTYTQATSNKQYSPIVTTSNNPIVKLSASLSYQFHFSLEYDFWKYFSVSLEPGVSNLQYNYSKTYNSEETAEDAIEYDEELRYVDLGCFFNFKLFPYSKNRILLSAGVSESLLISSEKSISSSNTSASTVNFLNSTNLAFLGRIGYRHRFSKYSIGMDLSYVHYMDQINNPKHRFINDPQAASITYSHYSIPDDITFKNIHANISLNYFLSYKVYK